MLDWFRGEIFFQHEPLPSGKLLSLDVDSELEWMAPKRLECRSSHETNLLLRSHGSVGHGYASNLLIDGNLAKFLQGHNCFGSRNVNELLALSFQHIYEQLEDHFFQNSSGLELTLARIRCGDYLIKMFDVNDLFDLGNDHSVESFLHAVEMKCRTRTGRALKNKGSIYFQKHSRRWAIKAYNKYRELLAKGKSHQLPDHLQGLGLDEFVKGMVRIELRLMSLELKDIGITHGYHLTEKRIAQLFADYLGRIEMNAQFQLIDEDMLKLPRSVQSTYQLWSQGFCLKNMLPSRTFYRHRKILLEHGIDITLMRDDRVESNIVPIIRVLEAVPVSIPSWAHEKGLLACR